MTSRLVSREILKAALPLENLGDNVLNLKDDVGVSIDSRTIQPREVFFAIRGEFDDGHRYMNEAGKKGAALIVCESGNNYSASNKAPMIIVEDSLKAFSRLASLHIAALNLTKIAITGSNGKTTTKEMLKAMLAKVLGENRVYASFGNINNHFGVPLSALEITRQHKIAIFEMGMNHPDEITNLCHIVSPDIGAITNISYAHGGNFVDGLDGVQRAKGELFQYIASKSGIIVVNLDDDRVMTEAHRAPLAHAVSFGYDKKADVEIASSKPFSMAAGFQRITLAVGEMPFEVDIPLAGPHQANNAACALAIVHALKLPVVYASLGLMEMSKTKGRMHIVMLRNGAILVNDAYNANPTSMKAGVVACRDIPAKRRIAAIGAMGELGEKSAHHHFLIGQLLAKDFCHLFVCGADSRHTVSGAKSEGMRDDQIVFADSSTELIEPIRAMLKKDDLLFVKGSLSQSMAVIANALMQS